jgi:hypothetical protein
LLKRAGARKQRYRAYPDDAEALSGYADHGLGVCADGKLHVDDGWTYSDLQDPPVAFIRLSCKSD